VGKKKGEEVFPRILLAMSAGTEEKQRGPRKSRKKKTVRKRETVFSRKERGGRDMTWARKKSIIRLLF